jgi:hypothetical protein
MESVQDIAEPLSEDSESPEVAPERDEKRGRSRRGRRDREERPEVFANVAEAPVIEFDDSGFERIIDDEDTGEMFKDAYMQEAIVDKVRAVEFDIESTSMAEVGSLIDTVSDSFSSFERIADEDEEQEAPAKDKSTSRGRTRKSNDDTPKAEKPKRGSAKSKSEPKSKAKSPRKKKAGSEGEDFEDAEASVREASAVAEMTVRRGGRGRRRGGRGKKHDGTEETNGSGEHDEALTEEHHEAVEVVEQIETAPIESVVATEPAP